MKVVVRKRGAAVPVEIHTEFITLEAAMKLEMGFSGGIAKSIILNGGVTVNGTECTMRGKKLYPGDRFSFHETEYIIEFHGNS